MLILAAFSGMTGCSKEDNGPDVYYSSWFSPTTWTNLYGIYYFDKEAPAITKDVIDKGAVMAYCMLVNDETVARPLPAYSTNNTVIWNFTIYDIGKIRFTTNVDEPSTSNLFRYIVIPGSSKLASTSLKGKSVEEISKMSYSDVCRALGIPE